MCLAPSQSQRDCVRHPRIARNACHAAASQRRRELPWAGGPLNLNPERIASKTLNTLPPLEVLEERKESGGFFNSQTLFRKLSLTHASTLWQFHIRSNF